ncbi:pyrroloquinoline quinone precursor peptide PqqA [Streptomyces sp. NPDC017979]|uniref:pyrroloquinoline quinone precursor peptide PqqA n=1 Tax=Streptomyces sp. NPDC017979 TaxID=3365024 RepID=UPI00379984C4
MNPTAATAEDPRAVATTTAPTVTGAAPAEWRSPGYEVVDTALEVTAYLHADR